jgi:hypothetical protein
MHKDHEKKLTQFFQEQGKVLEDAMREAGSPLPEGLTGEALIRGSLEELEQFAHSPEGQAHSARVHEIFKQVVAELPGGVEDPVFVERMRARMEEVFGKGIDGPNASA